MSVMLGVLGDSYRRQLRKPQERPKVDIVIDKVAAVADEIGVRPFGVDFGVGGLPSTDAAYLDELRGPTGGARAYPDRDRRLAQSQCRQGSLGAAAGEGDCQPGGGAPPRLAARAFLFRLWRAGQSRWAHPARGRAGRPPGGRRRRSTA